MIEMNARVIDMATADGDCPVYLHTPVGGRPWPPVILYMDGPGMRPAIQEIAARLATAGYAVFLPDLFYRAGPYAPIDPKIVWADPNLRAAHRDTLMSTASPGNAMADTAALLELIDRSPEAARGSVGAVGYCMGGRLALIAAGTFPDRIAVAASYHGGGLASDTPSSPHLLAARTKAKVYVAGASEDPNFPDEMKVRLETALNEAGVDHRVETYPAKHGWVPRDTQAHDPEEAEHHWRTLIPLFDGVLRRGG
jgi:carboxymethylenebutenolidase